MNETNYCDDCDSPKGRCFLDRPNIIHENTIPGEDDHITCRKCMLKEYRKYLFG